MSSTYRTAQKRIHGFTSKRAGRVRVVTGTAALRPCKCDHGPRRANTYCRACSRLVPQSPKEVANA